MTQPHQIVPDRAKRPGGITAPSFGLLVASGILIAGFVAEYVGLSQVVKFAAEPKQR